MPPRKKTRRTATSKRRMKTGAEPSAAPPVRRQAVLYARVSTKDQEREGIDSRWLLSRRQRAVGSRRRRRLAGA